MVLEVDRSHKKAKTSAKWSLRDKVVVPFLAGTIAISMFSGCTNERGAEYDDANDNASSMSAMDNYLKDDFIQIDDRTFVLKDGVEDPKYAVEEYQDSVHKVAGDDNLVVSGYIGREVARFKGDDYVKNNTLTKKDFNYITDLIIDPQEDINWIKYCNNLSGLWVRDGYCYTPNFYDDVTELIPGHTKKDALSQAPNLQRLHVGCPNFISEEYGSIKNLSSLKELSLNCEYVEPGLVESLTQLNKLEFQTAVNGVFTDFSKLSFLDSIEFLNVYDAAICMSVDEFNALKNSGVDIRYTLDDMDNSEEMFMGLASNFDEVAASIEFAEDISNDEKAGIIVSAALDGTEEIDEEDRNEVYAYLVSGVANRLGVRIEDRQVNRAAMVQLRDEVVNDNSLDSMATDITMQNEVTDSNELDSMIADVTMQNEAINDRELDLATGYTSMAEDSAKVLLK